MHDPGEEAADRGQGGTADKGTWPKNWRPSMSRGTLNTMKKVVKSLLDSHDFV